MAAIRRRSLAALVSRVAELATADDLDGTTDNTQAFDVTGALGVIIEQINDGTLGTAGIDVIEESHDGGYTWAACDTLLAIDSDATSGTVVTSGALNAAGTEPDAVATFKAGPFEGPTALRCGRKTTDTGGTTWVTGAPTVRMVAIGVTGGTLTALA
jgi:hypothetical protein